MADEELDILNKSCVGEQEGESVQGSIGFDLQKLMLKMKGEFMHEDGSGVDYVGLRSSPFFVEYQKKAYLLKDLDVFSMTENERKVFFLNIYNALTIHGLCVHNPSSVLKVEGFWRKTAYQIGPHTYSLDIIEHGILRSNALHPSTKKSYLESDDPRLPLVLSELDPRIHFALNCGANSCPPIRVFTEKNLERGLKAACQNFCQNEIEIQKKEENKKNIITLSKILMWYGKDFAPNDEQLLLKLSEFLTDERKEEVVRIVGSGEFEIQFRDYDWSLNTASSSS